MPTSGYLSQSLRQPLPTKDDGILRTVADAAGYMMALSKDRQRAHWQRAARLLLEEANAHDLNRGRCCPLESATVGLTGCDPFRAGG